MISRTWLTSRGSLFLANKKPRRINLSISAKTLSFSLKKSMICQVAKEAMGIQMKRKKNWVRNGIKTFFKLGKSRAKMKERSQSGTRRNKMINSIMLKCLNNFQERRMKG